uniref:Chemokine interleukin-8-like domain-containing protein n=1 Tax=Seriola dumerili TaxID=41447 RepID=A0A3B4V1D4_SERDU
MFAARIVIYHINNCLTFFPSAAIGPDNCCFTFYQDAVKRKPHQSYDVTDFRCPKTGVIFVTQKSRRICVDPSLSWVQGIMKTVDENSF